MKKKKILIMAAGTATAWHICEVIRRDFAQRFEIHLTDINDASLVPAAIQADCFHQVPPILSAQYRETMLSLLEKECIDYIIPLIDHDLFIFPRDDATLKHIGVLSTGPRRSTVEILADKRAMQRFLQKNDLETPRVYQWEALEAEKTYVVKPALGFGTRGFRQMRGRDIAANITADDLVQEACSRTPHAFEITAEIYQSKQFVQIFCRERIETKAGVCTKMRIHKIPEIEAYIQRLVALIECPTAFCAQFLCHLGRWQLIDCNLRLPAGTALASAAGFQLTRAMLANLLQERVDESFFTVENDIKTVLRVFREVVVR